MVRPPNPADAWRSSTSKAHCLVVLLPSTPASVGGAGLADLTRRERAEHAVARTRPPANVGPPAGRRARPGEDDGGVPAPVDEDLGRLWVGAHGSRRCHGRAPGARGVQMMSAETDPGWPKSPRRQCW